MKQRSTFVALLWKTLEQFGVLGIQFVIQILLARILSPDAYGVIAIVSIFISLSNVFIQRGFTTALIQKKDTTAEEMSSIFHFTIIVSIVFYLAIFFSARGISVYFETDELEKLLKVSSLSFFPGVYTAIATVRIKKDLDFKLIFKASIVSVLTSGAVGLILAYTGFGVWALVAQQLSYTLVYAVVLFILTKWVPKPILNFTNVTSLFSFGWKVLLTDLINEFFNQLRSIVIGRIYNKKDLAFYSKGRQFPHLLTRSINGAMQEVLLPRMSKDQDDISSVKSIINKSISLSSFLLFPILLGMSLIAKPLVLFLLTEKWLPIVPYIQIFCIYYSVWPITAPLLNSLYAIGASDKVLIVQTISRVLDLAALFVSMRYGVLYIAIGGMVVSLLSVLIYLYPVRKNIGYSFRDFFENVYPTILLSAAMGLVLFVVGKWIIVPLWSIIIQTILGAVLYFGLAKAFRLNTFEYFVYSLRGLGLKGKLRKG